MLRAYSENKTTNKRFQGLITKISPNKNFPLYGISSRLLIKLAYSLSLRAGKKKVEPATPPDPRKEAFPGLCLPDNQPKAELLLDEGNMKVATDAINEVLSTYSTAGQLKPLNVYTDGCIILVIPYSGKFLFGFIFCYGEPQNEKLTLDSRLL